MKKDSDIYDCLIIGGGINGAGIARECAGHGLKTCLLEAQDFAGGTSSASSKLIHGGLRYLEFYEFSLVRKALQERKILINQAPHIMWPLKFILPHQKHLRPKWMLRAGLFLYDLLAGSARIGRSKKIKIDRRGLKAHLKDGFEYFDGWVEDSRLVILNLLDAEKMGADIKRNCAVEAVKKEDDIYSVTTQNGDIIKSRTVVNAAGPWANDFLPTGLRIKLVKGSHIVVPNIFDHDDAFILQTEDGRIVFAIPYENDFTLIGTTDVKYTGDARDVHIDDDETDYLISLSNSYFEKEISKNDIVHSYSGVRPLIDDGETDAKKISRDYRFENDNGFVHILGGKLTTYRLLAKEAFDVIADHLNKDINATWSSKEFLPGGNIKDFDVFLNACLDNYKDLNPKMIKRMAIAYGAKIHDILGGNLGVQITPILHGCEVDYLIDHEWAQSVEDIIWRRSKLKLHMIDNDIEALEKYIEQRGVKHV